MSDCEGDAGGDPKIHVPQHIGGDPRQMKDLARSVDDISHPEGQMA